MRWLLLTGRRRAGVLAGVLAAALMLASWALIGFDGMSTYPRELNALSTVEGPAGVSMIGLASALGLPRLIGDLLALALAGALLGGAWWWGRAGDEDGDRRAFGLAVIAALSCSPVVWPHYLTLCVRSDRAALARAVGAVARAAARIPGAGRAHRR